MTNKLLTGTAMLALAGCVTTQAAPPTTVSLERDVSTVEGGRAIVNVVKTGSGRAKFDYRTEPVSATSDVDFVAVSGTMQTSGNASIAVQTNDDPDVEGPETFRVILGPKGNTTVGDEDSTVTIADNDSAAPPQPIQCEDGSTVIPPATCPVPPQPIQCPDGSTVIPPATCPPVVPPTSGNIPSNGLTGLVPIPSVDPAKAVTAANIPGSGAPDVVGAFRLTCGFAGLGRFDPKVYPGDMTGKSHGHQFYGNVSITPTSTYESLRTAGPSTCSYGDFPANRSAYWQPWLEDGNGNVLQPDLVTLYYKRRPPNDPVCSDPNHPQYGGKCVDMPTGMFYIFGFDFLTNTNPTGNVDFTCIDPVTNVQTVFKTLTEAANSGLCKPGGKFSSRANGPPCWDGKFVDTTNHRNHVGYGSYGGWGYYRCNLATHPYVIPQVSVLSQWTIQPGADLRKWAFASDYQRPDLPRGSTFHVDFWFLWEPVIKDNWHNGCIAKLLNCSGGNIGNGTMVSFAHQPIYPDPATGQPRYYWVNPYPVARVPGAEANAKLVGIDGKSATTWVRRKPRGVPSPMPLNPALDRFERIGEGNIEVGQPLPAPPPGTPHHGGHE